MSLIDELTIGRARELAKLFQGERDAHPVHESFAEKPVVVRSTGGVYFGYLVSRSGTSGRLLRARHVRRWTSTGLAGKVLSAGDLAVYGAGSGSSVASRVDTDLTGIHGTFDATATAVRVFEAIP